LEQEVYDTYINESFPGTYNGQWSILSTIRYDPKITSVPPAVIDDVSQDNFWLFNEHFQRLVFTVKFFCLHFKIPLDFEITKSFLFSKFKQAFVESEKLVQNSYKFRLLVKLSGDVVVEIHDTPQVDNLLAGLDQCSPTYSVYLDKEPTLMSPFTSFKTTNRPHYTVSRQRCLPGASPCEEVLIYNGQTQLMEGSITNIAVRRKSDGKWITPPLSSGCLCGVTRHFLLRKNFIEEETILVEDLQIGEEILLFNGILGVVKGTLVVLHPQDGLVDWSKGVST
jgi:branched-subunit amino acid aminotransferase/4-amino-4-deoxychorismate lyase